MKCPDRPKGYHRWKEVPGAALDQRLCSCGATAKIDKGGHTILQSHVTIGSVSLSIRTSP